ncbi:RT0821/Lpp0805 family surface protein [Stappia sp.]|uniref:RT0821/Lpp0805 family surface protein n=1 Tax=Stappia sp. TaxID=1870903 RepID=UPI0032D8E539
MTPIPMTRIDPRSRFAARGGRTAAGLGISLALALLAGACGGVSMPVGSADPATPLDLTGSIDAEQNTADVDIGAQDRAVIARAIATARGSTTAQPPFSWTNPLSGNSGTILALTDDTIASGTGCARFRTTANTIGGLRAYDGVACQDAMQTWQVIDLTEADGEATQTQAQTPPADAPQG